MREVRQPFLLVAAALCALVAAIAALWRLWPAG